MHSSRTLGPPASRPQPPSATLNEASEGISHYPLSPGFLRLRAGGRRSAGAARASTNLGGRPQAASLVRWDSPRNAPLKNSSDNPPASPAILKILKNPANPASDNETDPLNSNHPTPSRPVHPTSCPFVESSISTRPSASHPENPQNPANPDSDNAADPLNSNHPTPSRPVHPTSCPFVESSISTLPSASHPGNPLILQILIQTTKQIR